MWKSLADESMFNILPSNIIEPSCPQQRKMLRQAIKDMFDLQLFFPSFEHWPNVDYKIDI